MLKQSEQMYYNHLIGCFIKKMYNNDLICSCILIEKSRSNFVIVVVDVNNLNLIRILEKL